MTISRAPRRLPEFIKRAFVAGNMFRFALWQRMPGDRIGRLVQRTGKAHYTMENGVLIKVLP